ncbi:hypothetical protein VOLCADRAFT_104190 [Volvox carteri f. nagariensis]|uniref:Uncharacterized protein n=1 Tax=Volvox carteri f. nagariensis TaxID=3068 RepID=D8TS12_VOLCA|nr:uncharacterized protein VOLCADRAFT_104190 [Volvox carteri f. nagariensis]EFJ49745.1 hypothetical protein VOLCADRAFT_104190 [Volvox carteri f. nagariensis]|eukprot:XP_002949252.1 hypothetical protein VOLCADRAFT_104190 [Volvox carteri f. nagariensis]
MEELAGTQVAFPVRNRIFARLINGVTTNFVWNLYLDHLLLIITQIGTVGTVISARQDATFDGRTTFSISVVLGKREDPTLELAARQLVQQLGELGHSRSITLCLGLRDLSPSSVRELVGAVREDHAWC